MKTVLLTGSNGFLASNFIKKAKNNFKIFGIDLLDNINNFKNFKFKKINLKIKKELFYLKNKSFDIVIHNAAKQPRGKYLNDFDYFQNNILSTFNLINSLNLKKTKKIVYCSSFSVYDLKNKSSNIKEKSNLKPINFYGLTKKISEDILIYYSYKYNYNLVILRFDGIFGKNQNMPGFIENCSNFLKIGKKFELYNNGLTKRDQVYVEDASNAIIKAIKLKNKNKVEVFNIGGGNPIEQKKIVKYIKKKTFSSSKIILKKHKKFIFNKNVYMNINKARKILKYKPKNIYNNIDDYIN